MHGIVSPSFPLGWAPVHPEGLGKPSLVCVDQGLCAHQALPCSNFWRIMVQVYYNNSSKKHTNHAAGQLSRYTCWHLAVKQLCMCAACQAVQRPAPPAHRACGLEVLLYTQKKPAEATAQLQMPRQLDTRTAAKNVKQPSHP